MNLRRLKTILFRLSLQEQVIGISCLAIMVGLFLPWVSFTQVDSVSFTDYGHSGALGVIGFVIFIFGLLGLLYMLSESLRLPLPKLKFKREHILFFFTGQAAFLSLISLGVYLKVVFEAFDASLRFGLYTTLAASFFGALGSFSLIQKKKKRELNKPLKQKEEAVIEKKEEPGAESELNEELKAFDQDLTILNEIEKTPEKEDSNKASNHEEKVENKTEITKKEEAKIEPKKPITSQADYFNREAGMNIRKAKKSHPLPSSFYQDK